MSTLSPGQTFFPTAAGLLIALPLLFFGITFCGVPEAPVADGSVNVFKTSDPSRLYFKNIRSASYRLTRQPGGPDLYTLRTYPGKPEDRFLTVSIADNWRKDEAYIMIFREKSDEVADVFTVKWTLPDTAGYFTWEQGTLEQQYNFAVQVYNKLLSSAFMEIALANGNYVPLFGTAAERTALMTTMRDYFRLTDVSKGTLY